MLVALAVIGSCWGCMSVVETLARLEPGCMNLMTFSTFLFISFEGFFITTRCFSIPNKIPIRGYLKVVVVFFLVSVINNQALNFRIPVPLHIIFRSGSLLASLILGILILGRSYTKQKYVSVILVTVGIIFCTLASSQQVKDSSSNAEKDPEAYHEWIIGVLMLSFALVASAYLGICQEQMFTKYGKHPREAMFYVHALSLPGFLLMWTDITKHMDIFSKSTPLQLSLFGSVPQLWFYLFLCDVAQYACIRCVYKLTAESSALTVTLTISLRKFLSLLFSIWYFQNPFTMVHWFGTALVFGGTLMFSDVYGQIRKTLEEQRPKED